MKHTANDGRPPRRVYLDGVEMTRVIEADDEEGYIIRHTGKATRDEWETERLTGVVRVEEIR